MYIKSPKARIKSFLAYGSHLEGTGVERISGCKVSRTILGSGTTEMNYVFVLNIFTLYIYMHAFCLLVSVH